MQMIFILIELDGILTRLIASLATDFNAQFNDRSIMVHLMNHKMMTYVYYISSRFLNYAFVMPGCERDNESEVCLSYLDISYNIVQYMKVSFKVKSCYLGALVAQYIWK